MHCVALLAALPLTLVTAGVIGTMGKVHLLSPDPCHQAIDLFSTKLLMYHQATATDCHQAIASLTAPRDFLATRTSSSATRAHVARNDLRNTPQRLLSGI